jgi:hypothetical protein
MPAPARACALLDLCLLHPTFPAKNLLDSICCRLDPLHIYRPNEHSTN